MAEHNVGAILVTRSDELLGVFSERDYARKVILQGKSSRETALSEIMSSPVASVGPDQTIQDCMTMMTEQRIRHLPVIEEGALVGLVSIGDVVKAVIAEQEFLIGQLEKYISGGR
jgi:CBS domain-containing protein